MAPDPTSGLSWLLAYPEDLKRSALRRAWLADPAIRDFIGLSGDSSDFNASAGVPGSDSPTKEDARRPLEVTGEATESLDPERLAAERLTHDQISVLTGKTVQGPSSAQVK
jgi:hypothetical protein